MKQRFKFQKGQMVPQWIEKTENVLLVFDTEATAVRLDDGWHIWPSKALEPECIMRGKGNSRKVNITGQPHTTIYSSMKCFLQNRGVNQ